MYVHISKNANHKVDSYPHLCHSRGSGNLSSLICRGTMNCALPLFFVFYLPWARFIVPLHYCGFDESNPYNTLLISGRHKVCPYLYLTTLFFFFFFLFFLHYPLYAVRSTLVQLYVILSVNLILYKVPSIVFDLLQMEHRLTDRLLFGSWERQLPL